MDNKSNNNTESYLLVFAGLLFLLTAFYTAFISETSDIVVMALNGIAGVFLISYGLFRIFKK
jgi:uncharacterized membrane protein